MPHYFTPEPGESPLDRTVLLVVWVCLAVLTLFIIGAVSFFMR
jgi:hypothetical protein